MTTVLGTSRRDNNGWRGARPLVTSTKDSNTLFTRPCPQSGSAAAGPRRGPVTGEQGCAAAASLYNHVYGQTYRPGYPTPQNAWERHPLMATGGHWAGGRICTHGALRSARKRQRRAEICGCTVRRPMSA